MALAGYLTSFYPSRTLLPVASMAPTETNDSQAGTSRVTLMVVSLVICLLPLPLLQPNKEVPSVVTNTLCSTHRHGTEFRLQTSMDPVTLHS